EREGGGRARAEALAEAGLERQREKAGRGRDALARDDDGAVVKGSARREERHEQIVGDLRVEGNAVLDVGLQALPPLEDDQGSDAAARKRRRGEHEVRDGFLGVEGGEESA